MSATWSQQVQLDEKEKPLAEYMTLPASQYSVLDAERIERVDSSTFRCYAHRVQFFSVEICPVLLVRVDEEADGCTIRLLSATRADGRTIRQLSAMVGVGGRGKQRRGRGSAGRGSKGGGRLHVRLLSAAVRDKQRRGRGRAGGAQGEEGSVGGRKAQVGGAEGEADGCTIRLLSASIWGGKGRPGGGEGEEVA
ncbi:unnamed protein product [Closterium sp. NIES-64]|nr:unnamed protein product [Closterium sp. NIES-64]